MTNEFLRSIEELKETKKVIRDLIKKEKKLSTPRIGDFSQIKTIYSIFEELCKKSDRNPDSPHSRKVFIAIVLIHFQPDVFVGCRFRVGLRGMIADVTKVSHSLISHNCEDVLLYFRVYEEFREEVNYFCSEIANRLNG